MSGADSSERRAELEREHREHPPAAGVFAVRCSANGKVAVGSAMNVQGAINRIQFELRGGLHRTFRGLQEDAALHGLQSFGYEILDVLEPPKDASVDLREELKVLEALWLERLQPFGAAGYNQRKP